MIERLTSRIKSWVKLNWLSALCIGIICLYYLSYGLGKLIYHILHP